MKSPAAFKHFLALLCLVLVIPVPATALTPKPSSSPNRIPAPYPGTQPETGVAERSLVVAAQAAIQETSDSSDSNVRGNAVRGNSIQEETTDSKPVGSETRTDGWKIFYRKLFRPLLRLTLFIGIGLFIGNLIEAMEWTQHLGRVTRPLIRWGRLNDQSGVAFMAAFFSGVTANTMLVNAYKDEKLTRKELFFSNLINTLPSYFLHLPTTFFILLPLVRLAGVLYLACTLTAAIGRTLIVLTIGRFTLPKQSYFAQTAPRSSSRADLLSLTWRKFKRRFRRILKWTVPIYTLFFLLNQAGFFETLEKGLSHVFSLSFIPIEAISVIAFQIMAEFTAGAAAAGALLDAGTLTIKQTVLALLIGNVISSPVRALRHQLPYYMGIFTPRLGMTLLIVGQSVRAASILAVMILFHWFYPG